LRHESRQETPPRPHLFLFLPIPSTLFFFFFSNQEKSPPVASLFPSGQSPSQRAAIVFTLFFSPFLCYLFNHFFFGGFSGRLRHGPFFFCPCNNWIQGQPSFHLSTEYTFLFFSLTAKSKDAPFFWPSLLVGSICSLLCRCCSPFPFLSLGAVGYSELALPFLSLPFS